MNILDYWVCAVGWSIVVPIVLRFFGYILTEEWETFQEFYKWLWKAAVVFLTISYGIFLIMLGSGGIK